MTERQLYRVTATPWGHGWELDVEGVGVTETHDEDDATDEQMARSCIAITLEVPEDSFRIQIDYPKEGQSRDYGDLACDAAAMPGYRRWAQVRAEVAHRIDEGRVSEAQAEMRRQIADLAKDEGQQR